jgi:hypothetical protein
MTDDEKLLLSVALVLALEVAEFLAVRRESSDVYLPKLIPRLVYFFFTTVAFGGCLLYFTHSLGPRGPKDPPGWVFPALLVAFLLSRPSTLVSNAAGLTAYSAYGIRRRFLAWSDVNSIASEWKEETGPFRGFPRFMGYNVDVFGRDGSRIVHTMFLRRQARFLDVLREHVPRTAFAPGIYDWHPERS